MDRRACLFLPLAAPAVAQTLRTTRFIVPFAPGTSPDAMARHLAERLPAALAEEGRVVVENRPGAGSTIGTAQLARAAADGSVLGMSNISSHAIAPAIYPQAGYDPLRDFTHLAILAEFPLALAVAADGPYATLASLLDAARAAPGQLRVGSPGTGTSAQVALLSLRGLSGADIQHVPGRGTPPAILDTIAGRIEGVMAGMGEVGGNDRLRLLAVATEARLPQRPDLPTFREAGIDLVLSVWFGLCAPAGLPAPLADRIEAAAAGIAATADFATLVARFGGTRSTRLGRDGTTAFVASQARWSEVARAAGIRPE